jgi:hypothetical protein
MARIEYVRIEMNGKRYSVVIPVAALIIIGTRGVCLAQFSKHREIQNSEAQKLSVVQAKIPFSQSRAFRIPRLDRAVGHGLDQRIEGKFVFRVKRFVLARPTYRRSDNERNSYEARSSFVIPSNSPFEKFAPGDQSLFERRIRSRLIDPMRYRS